MGGWARCDLRYRYAHYAADLPGHAQAGAQAQGSRKTGLTVRPHIIAGHAVRYPWADGAHCPSQGPLSGGSLYCWPLPPSLLRPTSSRAKFSRAAWMPHRRLTTIPLAV